MRNPAIIATVAAAVLVVLVGLGRVRPIDGDEGYYAAAARLVAEGKEPYADFFYPQMPLLPHIYATAGRVTGFGLIDLRLVSALAGALTVLLWGLLLMRIWKQRLALLFAGLVLVAVDPYLLSWHATIKTYAMADLGVVAALWALDRALSGGRWWWALLAGAAVGLAVGVRALYAPWALAVVITAAVLETGRGGVGRGLRLAALTAAGAVVVLLPALVGFFDDPDRFVFNNLTYHQLRYSPHAAGTGWSRPLAAATRLGGALFGHGYRIVALALAVWGAVDLRRRREAPLRAVRVVSLAGLAAYVVGSLLPDPVYGQYFMAPVSPLLAPAAAAGLAAAAARTRRPGAVLSGVMFLAVVLSFVDLQARRTGMSDLEYWRPAHLARVSEAISRHTDPNDHVLALWSGYVSESGRRFVPGMENHFAVGVSEKLSLDDQLRYHVAGKELLLLMFTRRDPEAVVIGAWNNEVDASFEQGHLALLIDELDRNYEIVEEVGEVKIMTRRAQPLAPAPGTPGARGNR